MLLAAFALVVACGDNESEPPAAESPSPTVVSVGPSPSPDVQSPTVVPSQPPSTENDMPPYAFFTNADGETIQLLLEIADSPEERSVGLMNRESLPQDQGMLFDFQGTTNSGFWMRNTTIPLSIAFIDGNGRIVHIEDMQPLTEELHFSPELYRYAIEANQGWFRDNNIFTGNSVQLRIA
jgi:uncharacterized membrane protein (UPF0127 family)